MARRREFERGLWKSLPSPSPLVRASQVRAQDDRAQDDRAQALFARSSHVSRRCPVALCPYSCTF